jgi:hypothetical protein
VAAFTRSLQMDGEAALDRRIRISKTHEAGVPGAVVLLAAIGAITALLARRRGAA